MKHFHSHWDADGKWKKETEEQRSLTWSHRHDTEDQKKATEGLGKKNHGDGLFPARMLGEENTLQKCCLCNTK